MSGGLIVGKQLKFIKGVWTAGRDNEEEDIAVGARMIFAFTSMLIGWQCWLDHKCVETDLGLPVEGFTPKPRHLLSMWSDKAGWPTDKNGVAEDPWSYVNVLPLRAPGGGYYTYIVSSKGGKSAIGKMLLEIGGHARMHGYDVFPVVELGTDSYKHPQYGRVYTPVLKIVGWAPSTDFGTPGGGESAPAAAKPAEKKQLSPKKAGDYHM